MEDSQIVDLFWRRDQAAIDEAAKKYSRYCHSIAHRILDSDEDAEECVNDALNRAWNAIPPARPDCLSAFLGRIARNLSLNRYEKSRAGKRGGGTAEIALTELEECVPSGSDVEEEVEGILLSESIDRFLGALPKRHRILFVRRYWYLRGIADISADMGISESSVKSVLFRLRDKLKTHLQREGLFCEDRQAIGSR